MEYDEKMIDKIAEVAVEKILNRMPEVIGNLMTHHAVVNKLNKELYDKYPEFAENKELVVDVLESVEGSDLGISYEEVLKKGIPEIKKRLGTMKSLDMTKVQDKPSLTFNRLGNNENGAF